MSQFRLRCIVLINVVVIVVVLAAVLISAHDDLDTPNEDAGKTQTNAEPNHHGAQTTTQKELVTVIAELLNEHQSRSQVNLEPHDSLQSGDGTGMTGKPELSSATNLTMPSEQPASTREPVDDRTEADKDSTMPLLNSEDSIESKKKVECEETLCLNGGICLVMEDGQEKCICPEAFWGARCQLRNICKSIIADDLTGDQICNRIDRMCIIDDKLFRCQCKPNEYFVFKADYYRRGQQDQVQEQHQGKPDAHLKGGCHASTPGGSEQSLRPLEQNERTTFVYDTMLDLITHNESSSSTATPHASDGLSRIRSSRRRSTYYLAECRQVDKCLGVRCRQMSEVCEDGQCKCNRNLGYIRDPQDDLCKLLNPCNMPLSDGQPPVCGEARCLPTYNKELYRCVCPIGYHAVQRGPERSSTQCAILSNFICLIPLLNKCQHICNIDNERSSYKCSCLPGYRPGSRPGFDDHLCFFEENVGGTSIHPLYGQSELDDEDLGPNDESASHRLPSNRHQMLLKPMVVGEWTDSARSAKDGATTSTRSTDAQHLNQLDVNKLIQQIVKFSDLPDLSTGKQALPLNPRGSLTELDDEKREANAGSGGYDNSLGFMSPQDRCNMYCDENKICVLENAAAGSYRCICDRQGYVSVSDKCLDWCDAAEFSHDVRFWLDLTCVTGRCKRSTGSQRPPSNLASSFYKNSKFMNLTPDEQKLIKLEAKSSWRPTFQCDCSTSPLVHEDPTNQLCKLNFSAILEPCLPGNEGHTDCVINKHAYCAVLHKDPLLQNRSLISSQLMEHIITASSKGGRGPIKSEAPPNPTKVGAGPSAEGKKAKPKDKPYVCVCSPEKKFLVDKPRNKARCIDECDLLNNECGRFNRMCRAATINSNENFGFHSKLVREDLDGVRMNQFKRTGCECLPGFNVGPSEPHDFTLDTNYPDDGLSSDCWLSPAVSPSGTSNSNGGQVPHRFGWDALEDFLHDTTITVKNPPKVDMSVIYGDLVASQEIEHLRTRYMNINSRCLLDYDVVEFHARLKAPADFEPAWVKMRPAQPSAGGGASSSPSERTIQQEHLASGGESSSERQQRDSQAFSLYNSSSSYTPDGSSSEVNEQKPDNIKLKSVLADDVNSRLLKVPEFMRADMSELYKHIVLVADCNFLISQKSFQAYEQCIRYRYWTVQKFRAHFADWRQVMSDNLRETFDLMDGNIRFRVNKCETIIKRVTSVPRAYAESLAKEDVKSSEDNGEPKRDNIAHLSMDETEVSEFDPWDQYARVDADLDCKLTIHSASDYDASGALRNAKRVLLEKQLPKFIFSDLDFLSEAHEPSNTSNSGEERESPSLAASSSIIGSAKSDYYLMAPNTLIHRESYDLLAAHRKAFSPCNSEYSYCDKQTRCEMQDTVNYSCTCEAGYTPIGSRDIYFQDSRKEVCEDINECLFDVCKGNGLEDKSICVNEIGDYKCQCIRHHVGDNKRFCDHICKVIACKHGDCRIPDEHHAFCECYYGYREADCSVQDPSVALRKANMIICSSIFASVLLLAITLAISLNSQLKKTKKKLKRLEAAQEAVEFYEFSLQQPPYRHRVSKTSTVS